MNKTRKLIAGAVVLCLAGWLVHWRFFSEPEFQGHPYSYWMVRYYLRTWTTAADMPKTIQVWRDTGTNGTAYLVKLLTAPDDDAAFARINAQLGRALDGSQASQLFGRLVNRAFNIKTDNRYRPVDVAALRDQARDLLIDLRPDTEQLTSILAGPLNGTDARARCLALSVLAASNLNHVEPQLIRALGEEDVDGRRYIIDGILEGLARGHQCSPALMEAFVRASAQTPDLNRQRFYSQIIWGGPVATNVLLALAVLLKNEPNAYARFDLAKRLVTMGADQPEVITVVVAGLTNRMFQSQAARALGSARTRVQLSVTTLIAALKGPEMDLHAWTVGALLALGPAPAEAKPELARFMQSSDSAVRMVAAGYLLRLSPGDADALAVLVRTARQTEDPLLAGRAVFALGELRGAALGAAPELAKLLETARSPLKGLIQDALGKISAAQTNSAGSQ